MLRLIRAVCSSVRWVQVAWARQAKESEADITAVAPATGEGAVSSRASWVAWVALSPATGCTTSSRTAITVTTVLADGRIRFHSAGAPRPSEEMRSSGADDDPAVEHHGMTAAVVTSEVATGAEAATGAEVAEETGAEAEETGKARLGLALPSW